MDVPRFALVLLLSLVTAACGSEGATLGADASPTAAASHAQADKADCPATQAERTVPVSPEGFEGQTQLIPSGTPDSALLCEYSDGHLDKAAALTGDLAPIADELALPRKYGSHACTLIGRGGPLVSYLLRITAGSATAWVQSESDPNRCTETSNGSFASDEYEADVMAAWLKAGGWRQREPEPAGPTSCPYAGSGRPGDEKSLLPGTPLQVRICSMSSASYRDLTQDQVAELQHLLAEVKTQPSTNGCQGDGGDAVDVFASYANGRPSIMSFMPQCDPALDNGFTAGTPTADQKRSLARLLRTN
jgi:hypothetical protein